MIRETAGARRSTIPVVTRGRREVLVEEHDDDDDDVLASEVVLHVLPAARAPVAVVFRREGEWWLLARWDLQTGALEPGAWLRGTLYPRCSDVSPDGQLLHYLMAKRSRRPFMGMVGRQTYSALSRVPWAFALAAWPESGTETWGYHFVAPGRWDPGRPGHGDDTTLRQRYGLARTAPTQYAAERRRGWVEHESCPLPVPGDAWDEQREVVLARPSPVRPDLRLVLQDRGWSEDEPGRIEGRAPEYRLEIDGRAIELDDVTWADWIPSGHLIVATDDARLQVREADRARGPALHEHDLLEVRRAPGPAPDWAQRL